MLEGSKIVRGRKNRRNIRKQVVRKPTTAAQTIRRRILLTGGSGALSTTGLAAFGTGLAAGGDLATAEGDAGAEADSPVAGIVASDSSRLAGLSTVHTSIDWNLRRVSKTASQVHVYFNSRA